MRFLYVAWGVLSLALAFGINAYMAPRVDRARDAAELATARGKLVFHHAGGKREFPLITMRPIVQDLVYPFGKRIEVRELTIRSAATGADPDLELFVDLAAVGASGADREVRPWLKHSLPVLSAAFGGSPLSRVRLAPGADPVGVVEGALTLVEARPLRSAESGEGRWRVRGELVLTVLAGGEIQQANGALEGEVAW